MRSLRSNKKSPRLTFAQFKRRYVEPTFKRLRKKGICCSTELGRCCLACCRNDMLALGRPRFLRLWRFNSCEQRMACVLGEYIVNFSVVRREFQKSGVVFERYGAGYAHYACTLRPRKVAHLLWAIVRTHVHALAFMSWLKGLVAARRYHPANIDFDTLAEDLRVDIAELRR